MKRLIFILLGVMFTMPSLAQLQRQKTFEHNPIFNDKYVIDTIYYADDVVYEHIISRSAKNGKPSRLSIDNLSNVMMSNDITLRDGSPLPRLLETYSHGEVYMAGLKRALSETFCNYKTQNEQMGVAKDYMWIYLIFSSETGKALEVSFSTSASETVLSLPITLWATLEQKIKDYVYTDLSDAEESRQLSWLFTAIMARFSIEIIGLKANDRISIPATNYGENLINP